MSLDSLGGAELGPVERWELARLVTAVDDISCLSYKDLALGVWGSGLVEVGGG